MSYHLTYSRHIANALTTTSRRRAFGCRAGAGRARRSRRCAAGDIGVWSRAAFENPWSHRFTATRGRRRRRCWRKLDRRGMTSPKGGRRSDTMRERIRAGDNHHFSHPDESNTQFIDPRTLSKAVDAMPQVRDRERIGSFLCAATPTGTSAPISRNWSQPLRSTTMARAVTPLPHRRPVPGSVLAAGAACRRRYDLSFMPSARRFPPPCGIGAMTASKI